MLGIAMEFWTIEVSHGPELSAGLWRDAHGESLVEAALTHGARDWAWVVRDWGVLLEVGFEDESDWLRFRATPAVGAALDAVPDPVNGLLVYSGRGGSSGAPVRRPRHHPLGAGAAALPLPEPDVGPPILGTREARLDPASACAVAMTG